MPRTLHYIPLQLAFVERAPRVRAGRGDCGIFRTQLYQYHWDTRDLHSAERIVWHLGHGQSSNKVMASLL
ncbi:MAG TPA: hypothetical protein VFS83_11995, partial [Ktedonobacterales bacterium]|nr:hypothetical protein [Ktedonobacterales bacterium]